MNTAKLRQSPRYKRNRPWRQYWAFSKSELADPGACHGDDELVAFFDLDTKWEDCESQGVIVHRNGRVLDRLANGTPIPQSTPRRANELQLMVRKINVLVHPNGEETLEWRDVLVDQHGNFIKFLDVYSYGKRKGKRR